MKIMNAAKTFVLSFALAPILAAPALAQPPQQSNNQGQNVRSQNFKAQVEVVFVLDTTGSMGELIDGAKKKIWSIVNEIASAQPTPIVKIGFVAYRDKGDAYVTQVVDLNSDLDKAFATLQTLQADGGGDTPEHVSKGLSDGVHEISWTRGSSGNSQSGLYQVLFLVGDCPPHTDYNDGYDYKKHAREAAQRGIVINTIRCGGNAQTQPIWQEIAGLGKGDYFSIAQSGGVVSVATPYDTEIGTISDKLELTTVARRGAVYAARASMSHRANAALSASGKADRAEFNSKSTQVYGTFDIVAMQAAGKIDVAKMKDEELPENMRKMTRTQRVMYIEARTVERRKLQARLGTLQVKRAAYIRGAAAKKPKTADGFDVLVNKTIKRQAAKKGLKY